MSKSVGEIRKKVEPGLKFDNIGTATLIYAVLRSRSRSRWRRNYLRPGAGAGAEAEKIIFPIVSLEDARMKKNLH